MRAWLMVVLGMVAGCGGSEPASCEPDAVRACGCPGGGSGTQVCSAFGTSFGECSGCPEPDLGVAFDASAADLSPGADLAKLCARVEVTTLAGNGVDGFLDGTGGASGTTEFVGPYAVAADQAGNTYVADTDANRIRKVAPDGTTTTLAGNGADQVRDGSGGPDGFASFSGPTGIAFDHDGTVYVVESAWGTLRKISADGWTETVVHSLYYPNGVAVDAAGTVYVAETGANRISKVTPQGVVTTLAGSWTAGFVDGDAGSALFNVPAGLAVDAAGNVYVADNYNHRVRKIAADGTTTTLTGSGIPGFFDGTGGANGTTKLFYPTGVVVDEDGFVYITEGGRVRKATPAGATTLVAGTTWPPRFADGNGCIARLSSAALARSGKRLLIADVDNVRIRQAVLP
jgi:sugar lactone lactonase YvrE